MYPFITSPSENRGGRAWAALTVVATCDPAASRRSPRRLLASRAAGLWHGAEAAGVVDAMIEATLRVWLRYSFCFASLEGVDSRGGLPMPTYTQQQEEAAFLHGELAATERLELAA